MSLQFNGGPATAPTSEVFLTIREASQKYRICVNSLRSYSNSGKLRAFRVGGNNARRFLDSDLKALLNYRVAEPQAGEDSNGKAKGNDAPHVLLVARVSTPKQQASGDLSRQVQKCEAYIQERWGGDASVEKHIAVRSGLNFDSHCFHKMIQQITSGRFQYLVVLYKERLARVAFSLIETLCRLNGVEIVVIEKAGEDSNSNQEMIEDLLAITHVYSCRVYSKRGAQAKVKHLAPELVEYIHSLVFQGFSERYIYNRLTTEGKNRDQKGVIFSIGTLRRCMVKLRREDAVKTVVDGHTSPASFSSFAALRLRFAAPSRGTSEANIFRVYHEHCDTLNVRPERKGAVLAFLKAKCPNGPIQRADGPFWEGVWVVRNFERLPKAHSQKP